jgi:mycothione reductase
MKEYDVIVVGSGAGLLIIEKALAHDLSVALVDKGPLGGTCLNLGCIPSKMLVYPGDKVAEIREAGKLGVSAAISGIDFPAIMERMRNTVSKGENHIREGIKYSEDLDFYEGTGYFVKDSVLEIKGEQIKGRKIFIACGARPRIPAVKGIQKAEYLTNESVLQLRERPESLIIIGGGYIGAEYAHFFSAMGVKVTLLQGNTRLVPDEEPEISDLLKKEMGRWMDIRTGTEAVEVGKASSGYAVTARDLSSGRTARFQAEKIMIAAGRTSNADLLKVENSGVKTDDRGYIKVNEYFETGRKNIWAFGDVIGKKMFRHVANREASLLWDNAGHDKRIAMDYRFAPHAVFSYPEIASVGLTEEQARQQFHLNELLVGKARYSEVARGEAMMEEESFAKAIVKRDGKILGFHIIGPYASILIQEVITSMANDLDIWSIGKAMHIHPALTEVIVATFGNLQEVE